MYVVLYLLIMAGLAAALQPAQDRVSVLEARVESLETFIRDMEPTWVKRYGLIKRCVAPEVENGWVECSTDEAMKPGATCSLSCKTGYVAAMGHEKTTCVEGGDWSIQLKCEVPLVVIGGGLILDEDGDVSVEVLDFDQGSDCKVKIPDMPNRGGSMRTYSNLIYNPGGRELLVCNGLTTEDLATCDAWKISQNPKNWKFHSHTNKGSSYESTMDAFHHIQKTSSFAQSTTTELFNPNTKCGRYAAESATIDNKPYVFGGMLYKKTNHWATETVRQLEREDWTRKKRDCSMSTKRAFFCTVKLEETGAIHIGGFTDNGVTDNVEFRDGCSGRKYHDLAKRPKSKMGNLPSPLSGHGCAMLPNSTDILVSGGSRDQTDSAKKGAYIYRMESNAWYSVSDMKAPRFGHKIVTVGERVFAIGGKERNPDKHLDTIEEYDIQTGEWTELDMKMRKTRSHFGLALIPRSALGC